MWYDKCYTRFKGTPRVKPLPLLVVFFSLESKPPFNGVSAC